MGLLARIAAPYREGLEGLDRRAFAVVTITLLGVGSRMSVYTFLGIYFTREIHFSLALVGLGFLAENLLRGLAAPWMGAWSDRIGRRRVILVAALATAATMPLFLFVRTPAQLLAWSALLGLAQSGLWPAASALLLDLARPERRQSVLSLNYTAISIGYTLGVAPAGFVVGLGFPALAAMSATGFLLIALVVLVALRGPMPATRAVDARTSLAADVARAPRDRAFLLLAALAFVFPLGIGLIASVTPLYAEQAGLHESAIGIALAINGPILAIFSIPVAARIERYGPYRFLGLSAAILAASYLPLVASGSFGALALATLVFTVGELIFSSAIPAAVAGLAPAGMRGAYQGAWAMVFSIGVGAAVSITGLLRADLGWSRTWIAWALASAVAAGALLLTRRWFAREAERRADAPQG